MAEATLLVAFLGGVLSLLSPCSALLLPAFFAYSFGGRALVGRTAIFYAGLCTTLVPLGVGVSAVSALFYGQRSILIIVAGLALISLGVLIVFGRGMDVSSVGGGSGLFGRLRSLSRGDSAGAVYALGAVYGFAGFCSGPILDAILTVAAASGGAARGALLLAIYALGMAAPLFVLALVWERLGMSGSRFLRGQEFRVFGFTFHTTNVVSGLIFIALGVAFIAYEGTSALGGFYEVFRTEDLALSAQERLTDALGFVPSWVVIVAVALVAAAFLIRNYLRSER